jgi:hypothetical protein
LAVQWVWSEGGPARLCSQDCPSFAETLSPRSTLPSALPADHSRGLYG